MSVAMRGNREGGLSDCFCVIARASGVIEIVNPTTGAATAVLPAAEAVERDARQIVALKALWPGDLPTQLLFPTRRWHHHRPLPLHDSRRDNSKLSRRTQKLE